MNKKFKKLFNLLALSPTLLVPLALVSQTPGEGQNPNPGTGGEQQNPGGTQAPQTPPKNAEDFDSFKEIAENATKEMVTNAVNNFISWVDDQKQRINTQETDFQKKLSKITYLNILSNFFKKNKDEIIANPSAKDLNIIFPLVAGTQRNVDISNIKYNNEDFNGVWVGSTNPTDYKTPLGEGTTFQVPDGGKDQVNSWDKKKLEESLGKYGKSLLEEFNKLIYKEEDALEIDKDYFLSLNEDPKDNRYDIKPPQGYNSWDEYIVSKFKPRISKFDLEKNIELTKEEQEQQQQQQPPDPDNPDNPDQDKPTDPVKTQEISQGIPPLSPELKWHQMDDSDIAVKFDSNKDSNNEIFFFKNPVNTRYKYTVQSVKKEGDKYIAEVKLSDTVEVDKNRTYTAEVKVHNNKKSAALTELTYQTISKLFTDLYKSLGIDEKINYTNLESNQLSDALFQIVNSGVQLINTASFIKNYEAVQNAYANDISLIEVSKTVLNSSGFEDNLTELTLASMKTSQINNLPYYYSLVNALNRKKELLKNRITRNDKLEVQLKEKGIDIKHINTFYSNLETKIYKLRKSTDLSTFNVTKWYERFIQNIKIVSEELLLLQKVIGETQTSQSQPTQPNIPAGANAQENIQSQEPAPNPAEDEQQAAYKEIIKRNNQEVKTNGSIIMGFGISLWVMGLIASIANTFMLIKAFTTDRWKQYRKLSILLATSFVVAIIVGIVLHILGL